MKVVNQNLKQNLTRKSLWPDGFVLSSAVSNFSKTNKHSKIENAFIALEPPSFPLTRIKNPKL